MLLNYHANFSCRKQKIVSMLKIMVYHKKVESEKGIFVQNRKKK